MCLYINVRSILMCVNVRGTEISIDNSSASCANSETSKWICSFSPEQSPTNQSGERVEIRRILHANYLRAALHRGTQGKLFSRGSCGAAICWLILMVFLSANSNLIYSRRMYSAPVTAFSAFKRLTLYIQNDKKQFRCSGACTTGEIKCARLIVCPSSFTIELTFLSANDILKTDSRLILSFSYQYALIDLDDAWIKYNEKTTSFVNMAFREFCEFYLLKDKTSRRYNVSWYR